MDAIIEQAELPSDHLKDAWTAIKVAEVVRASNPPVHSQGLRCAPTRAGSARASLPRRSGASCRSQFGLWSSDYRRFTARSRIRSTSHDSASGCRGSAVRRRGVQTAGVAAVRE